MQEKTFPGTLDSLALVRAYVSEAARTAGLDSGRTYNLCLAVDEIATNIVLYGYEEVDLKGDISVEALQEPGQLIIRLFDHGRTYDPDQVPEPDLENPLKQQSGGGGVSAKPAWISSTTLRPIPATCIVLWCVYLGRLLLTIICDHEWMITRPSPMFARRPSHTEFGVARPRKQLRVVYARPQSNHYDMDLVRSLSDRRLLGGVHVLRPAFLK